MKMMFRHLHRKSHRRLVTCGGFSFLMEKIIVQNRKRRTSQSEPYWSK